LKSVSAIPRLPVTAFACFLALSLGWLGLKPLDLDEAIVLTRSSIPVADLLLIPYSPLYLLLLHAWTLVSTDTYWLRLLGVILSVIGLALAPRVMRAMGGTHAATGAVWLLALSPFFVHQARSLSPAPLAFVTVLALYLCFFEYTRAGQWAWLVAWTVVALAMQLVHGGLFAIVLIQCLAMGLFRERLRNKQRNWWLAQILPAALFALLFGAQFNRFVADRISEVNAASSVGAQWARLGTDLPLPWSAMGGGLLLLLLVSGVIACRDWRRDLRHTILLLGAAVPLCVWLLWLSHDFYAVAALPCLATLGAIGIRTYPRWGRQMLWTAAAVTYGWSHWQMLPPQ
jgi:hypothetical protein